MLPDMRLSNGKPIWYCVPEKTPLILDDLKSPVLNIRRYNGGSDWTLAQHLALGILLASSSEVKTYFAMHDLHEAILGDIVTGLKKYIPDFEVLESRWENYFIKIFLQNNFPSEQIRREVKMLDLHCLKLEMYCLNHKGLYYIDVEWEPSSIEEAIFKFVKESDPDFLWYLIKDTIESFTNSEKINE
jgi:hypothetical protein